MMHAALLGYVVVTCAVIVARWAYVLIRLRGLESRPVLRPPVPAAGRDGIPDDTGQFPRRQRPRAHGWPGWVLAGAVAGLVACGYLAAAGGPDRHDAANVAAGWVGLFALAALCLAAPVALYRRCRSRRVDPVPPHDGGGRVPGASAE